MAGPGTKLLASDVNSLFSRLNTIRINHNNEDQPADVQAALTPPFNETPSIVGKKPAATVDSPGTDGVGGTVPLMKQYINTLRKSIFLTDVTEEQVNQIVTPSAGDLLKYLTVSSADDLITVLERHPHKYTTNFRGFNSNNFGFNGSNFTNFAFNAGNFNNFSFNSGNFFDFSFHSGNFQFNGNDFTHFAFSTEPTTPHTNQRFDGRFFLN